jgi:RND family efflux transporter MFP subunit
MSPHNKTIDALRIDRANAPRRTLTSAWILTALLFIALTAGLIWRFTRPRPVAVRTLVIQNLSSGDNRTLLNASGYVTARRAATISSKITGKVMEVMVEEGMRIEADQMLARLDSSNVEKSLQLAQAQLKSARSEIAETQARLVQAERELRWLEGLKTESAASQIEIDRAETEVRSLQARLLRHSAQVAVTESEVALWQQQLDDTIIRAPFSGIVTSKDAQPGEVISPVSAGGGFTRTGICTIVDMNSLEIEVDVSETYINRVQPDQPVEATLDSYPEWRIPARVIAIVPTADRQKATVKVRVGFKELDPRILPDMSAKVAFQSTAEATTTQPGVTIPESAVSQRDGRDVVWIVRDGRVERRAVTVAARTGDEMSIAAGISAGERVVAEGVEGLSDGARVKEENE